MTKISIIGSGNVAYHLCKAFSFSGQALEIEIFGRNKTDLIQFHSEFKVKILTQMAEIDKTSIVFVCVSDDQIQTVINGFDKNQFVVYTSGTIALDFFKDNNKIGVFYPLQTFSKNREIDFTTVPILIEAKNLEFEKELVLIAKQISNHVELADSTKRQNIHLAAVFANNFTNHILHLSKTILDKNNINWSLLKPLIQESFLKINEGYEPKEIQTGPAKRNDFETIKMQEGKLNGLELDIYKLITKSIIKTYRK